jgi:hypothetical protein
MGIGDSIVGALKSGVARLEASQKKLEPYEKEIYSAAKTAVIQGEAAIEKKARQAYLAEKKALPGQVKAARKLARKTGAAIKTGATKVYEFEKEAYPAQKKIAQTGVEFLSKGFEEAYGKKGMFGGAATAVSRGLDKDEEYEEAAPQIIKTKRSYARENDDIGEGKSYIDEYMEKFERDFSRQSETTRERKRSSEPQTPMERYLRRYENKMSKRGL